MPTRNTPMPLKTLEGSLQDQILEACSDKDVSQMHTLLDEWHQLLFSQAAKSGNVAILQHLLDRYSSTPEMNQLMLEQAAQHGNTAVFSFLLHQQPEPVISDRVRSNALDGGVEIWKAIIDHKPELINYDFGHNGHPLAMAAMINNAPLLRFFLETGLDPNKSRFVMTPIIDIASKTPSVRQDILDLLIQYGATTEKSQAATKEWQNI
ncbi:MAG: hypothetical protein Q9168_008211 [Polycauliona sp. 1 TL-2023]